MDTRKELVAEIEKHLSGSDAEQRLKLIALIARAKDGDFHDWQSKYAAPKVACVLDLENAGLHDLAKAVRNGDYDEEPDTDDHKAVKNAEEEFFI